MPNVRRTCVVSHLPAFRFGGVWYVVNGTSHASGSALHPSLTGRSEEQ